MASTNTNTAINDFETKQSANLPNTWKNAPSEWGHSLHALAPYVGGFPPSLAHYFITRYTTENETVFDPFSGGGTTALESILSGRNALGSDAFEYAYTLTNGKCNPLPDTEFNPYLSEILQQASQVDNTNQKLLENTDLTTFYSKTTLDQLLRVREILHSKDTPNAAYLKALICGVLHGPSDMYLSAPMRDTYSSTANAMKNRFEEENITPPERDLESSVIRKHRLATTDPLPTNNYTARIEKSDSRDTPFEDHSADFILTSPPYLSVLDYSWNNWIRLWWLNANRSDEQDAMDLTADLEKYRAFMRETLTEMYRVLSPDSYAVLVVGDVVKRLTSGDKLVVTARLIAEEAIEHTEFTISHIVNDAYELSNRNYAVFNQLRYDYDPEETSEKATTPIDRCLVLKKGNPEPPTTPDVSWEARHYTGQKELDTWM